LTEIYDFADFKERRVKQFTRCPPISFDKFYAGARSDKVVTVTTPETEDGHTDGTIKREE
jgi:hypothetical protein